MHSPRWRSYGSLLSAVALAAALPASPPEPRSAAEIAQELHHFRELGTVLFIAAHPDDENSRILTWLARGRGYRTAYLSLTRGDGGQNLIGSELREALGLIRTHELLAARRVDGGEQFFSRARSTSASPRRPMRRSRSGTAPPCSATWCAWCASTSPTC